MRQAEDRHGRRRGLAVAWLAAALILSGPAQAQNPRPPIAGVESIESNAIRLNFDAVISNGGWYLIGNAPENYRIGTGMMPGATGKYAGFLQACGLHNVRGHGALERTIPAGDFAGKRVRITARLNNAGSGTAVTFYAASQTADMTTLRSRGKTPPLREGWQTLDLVMDVPDTAHSIEIGLTLAAVRAIVWLDGVAVDVVDETVPVAGRIIPVWLNQRGLHDPAVSCDGVKY